MSTQAKDGYMKSTNTDKKIMDFVDGQRKRCLWYMPDNYYPVSTLEELRRSIDSKLLEFRPGCLGGVLLNVLKI